MYNNMPNNKKITKKMENQRKRKIVESSDSDSDSSYHPDDSDEENEEMDQLEYKKFLAKMFPSKHINKQVKDGKHLKKMLKADAEKLEEECETSEYETLSEEEDEENNEEEEEENTTKTKPGQFNIILSIGPKKKSEEDGNE